MPVVFLDGPNFSGLAWTFKLLPSKHTETSIWSLRMIKVNVITFSTLIGKIQLQFM
jgi:hypothetical protein